MSASSNLGVLEGLASSPLDTGDSVSAYRAWAIRNNLAHLIDESTQVRINWVGTSVDGDSNDTYKVADLGVEPVLTGASVKRIWAQEFPITWIREDRPVNLDLHVRAATTGDTTPTLIMYARVVPASFPIGDPAAPVLVSQEFHSEIDPTPDVAFNVQWQLTAPAPELDNYEPLGVLYEEDDSWHSPHMAMMRLEISLDEYTNVDNAVHEIVSVYLREYA